jgi:hypothetical protein
MSYNIDTDYALTIKAHMTAKSIRTLFKAHCRNLPEDNFLENLHDSLTGDEEDSDLIPLKNVTWRCTGSGRTYEAIFIKKICPHIKGEVEVVFTWEGGDSQTGLRIRDGKVTRPKVLVALADD